LHLEAELLYKREIGLDSKI